MCKPVLWHLANRVAVRLRAKNFAGRTITVRVRFADMRAVTRSITLDVPILATTMVAEIAEDLVRGALADHPREKFIPLLAVSILHLRNQPAIQLDLPFGLPDEKHRRGARKGLARGSVDRAMDAIRSRFGRDAVGYATTQLRRPLSVPDAFRELAEKNLGDR